MSDRITKTQRWLDLIAFLLSRRTPVTVEAIMEEIAAYAGAWETEDEKARASVRRMFERDKDELRAMGIPIESTRYTINFGAETLEGYQIQRRDFYLPYLRVIGGASKPTRIAAALPGVELDPAEAATALEALRRVREIPSFPFAREARSALAKLKFDIDAERHPGAPVIRVERPGAHEVMDRLRTISASLLARKRVSFRYHGIYRGEPTDRTVEPYGIFFQREWYLVANDPARQGVRLFRVSRMDEPEVNPRAPKERDYEIPTHFDLRTYVGRRAWELSEGDEQIEATVLFRFPSSLLAAHNQEGERVTENPDGSVVRRFQVSDPDPFLRWVLGFAGEASVLGPAELVDAFRQMASEVGALYGRADA